MRVSLPVLHHPARLEADVASLEVHVDSLKAAYMLNADKLDYNHRVLGEWRGRLWLHAARCRQSERGHARVRLEPDHSVPAGLSVAAA